MAQPRPDTHEKPAAPKKVTKPPARHIKLTSPAFADGGTIPVRHTAFGDDVSPRLTWGEVPRSTDSLALMCDDPDSKSGKFIHWLVWNIEPAANELPEDALETGAGRDLVEGENGFGGTGYAGPKPPPGKPHRYVFRLYALDTRLELPKGASRVDFEQALEGHILAEGVLTGMYGR
jgi:Raf kinase inhibitor-like YbhB/YbcL family protein